MSFFSKIKSLLGGSTKKQEPVPELKPKRATGVYTLPTYTPQTSWQCDPNKPLEPVPPVNTKPKEEPKPEVTKEDFSGLVVMLDNGHGEETPGKRSPDGRLREYSYAREIVKMIKAELDNLGIEYYIVVPETRDVKLKTRVARANKKYEEIKAAKKKAIFISVHCNAAKNGEWYSARGWSGWTSKGQTAGDKLADCLYEAAHEVLDPKKIQIRKDKSDGDEDWENNFTVITETNMPACLTENFFQDNKEDVAYLLSDEGKNDVVKIHVEGIKKYIRKYVKKK
jgi:N-acetylmuramoyl-L-alanine amidase